MTSPDSKADREPAKSRRMRWVEWRRLILVWLILILCGTAVSLYLVDRSRQNMQTVLKEEVTLISWAIRADHVHDLVKANPQAGSPLLEQIKKQIDLARTIYPYCRDLRIVYTDGPGEIKTLAGSEISGFRPCPAIDLTLKKSLTGFETDHTRGIARICVPLHHPYTDKTVGALVFDADTTAWNRQLIKELLPVALYTLGMMAAAAYLFVMVRRRARSEKPNWRPEVIFVCWAGLLSTGMAVHTAHRLEYREHMDSFRRTAGGQASLLQQSLFRIGDNYIEGIARFFESSNFVDAREYSDYVAYLLNRPYAPGWLWIPEISPGDLTNFEKAVRESGRPEYSIRLHTESAAGKADELLYPVCYAAPGMDRNDLTGLELSGIPSCRLAIERARRTGLTSATEPVVLTGDGSFASPRIVVFRPVFNRDGSGRLAGLVSAVLDPDMLLYRAMSRNVTLGEAFSSAQLMQITEDGRRLYLTGGAVPEFTDYSDSRALVSPAFAFGNVYALAVEPGPGFTASYPFTSARNVAAAGLLTTALLTFIASLLASHRHELEQRVRIRQNQLALSEKSYHGLFNSIRQALYIIDEDMNLVDVNDGALQMYGYERGDMIGKSVALLAADGRNDHIDFIHTYRLVWEGSPYYTEFWGKRKNGEVFPKEVWLYKSTYFGKEAVIAIANEISERKKAEAEQERLRVQLMQSQKMESVGRLAGGIAHDFNNMLQAILGNAALARREVERKGSPVEYLKEIQNSAERSAALTRQLLAFASKQTIRPRPLNLNDAVEGMMNMLQLLVGENIKLKWSPGRDLWPAMVDTNQIDQILANLVVNARDAIEGTGHITIQTDNFTCDRSSCREICSACHPGEYVRISVQDDGCGMDEEVMRNMFEPFFTTKEPGKGTGLGLATVFGIVNQNNGIISVKSNPGEGTGIHIMLPRVHTRAETPRPASAVPEAARGTETVLLVEDEASVLRLGVNALQSLGYKVLPAATSNEAVELARKHGAEIDIIVTDVILPGMNGRDLVAVISSLVPSIAVIFMSGYTADVINDRGVIDETVHFVQKPFTIPILAAKIREALDRSPEGAGENA